MKITRLGRRIVVVGASGSGKTFVAQRLAAALEVPYVCNDAILFRENWTPNPKPLRFEEYERATRGDGWTFDGNIGSLRAREDAMILNRADTLIWIDLPRLEVMRQVILRSIVRVWTREKLWHGNVETFANVFARRDSIILWSWKTHRLRREEYRSIFADPKWSHICKLRLTSRAAVDRWLRGFDDGERQN